MCFSLGVERPGEIREVSTTSNVWSCIFLVNHRQWHVRYGQKHILIFRAGCRGAFVFGVNPKITNSSITFQNHPPSLTHPPTYNTTTIPPPQQPRRGAIRSHPKEWILTKRWPWVLPSKQACWKVTLRTDWKQRRWLRFLGKGAADGWNPPHTVKHVGVFHKYRGGPPKWMVYNGKLGTLIKIGWFGGTTIFGNIHAECCRKYRKITHQPIEDKDSCQYFDRVWRTNKKHVVQHAVFWEQRNEHSMTAETERMDANNLAIWLVAGEGCLLELCDPCCL